MTTETSRTPLDPVTLGVLGGAFQAIGLEMGHALKRMAYSPAAQQVEDLGGGLFTAEGLEICESDTTPMHIGSIPAYVRGFMRRLEGKVEPGDIIIHNNPYHGASHSPDLCVAIPIFHEGDLLAWSASTIHLSDTGGVFPGIAIDVHDVWAESKIYDSLKLYEKGVRNEQLWQFFVDNTRTPSYVVGDTEAMIAAGRLGERRFLGLIEKYGRETVMQAVDEFLDYCERMMRAQIEQVPDGSWEAEGYLDDDGRNRDQPLFVKAKVTIEGSEITIDLSESCDNVPDGLQRAVRRQRAARHLHRDPLGLPRRGHLHGLHPPERRHLPPDQRHRARGVDLQPHVPPLRAVTGVPDHARVRLRDPRALRGGAGPGLRRLLGGGRRRLHRLHPGARGVLGPHRDQRGGVRRTQRQGRPGRDRRPHGELAQHSDRGDRLAVPASHRALRDA